MTAEILSLGRASYRRWDKFHKKCIELARSHASFHRSFVINHDHIVMRGTQQSSSLRTAIEPMHIAAAIIGGRINYPTCNDSPTEIAIDAAFRDFKYVEFGNTNAITEMTVPRLQVRVVLRDNRIKIAVVTVHPNQEQSDPTIPEVSYDIW